jgi:hypothetical protein
MTIYQILMTKYQRLFHVHYKISTKDYVRIYKPFMQNKANLGNDKMNISLDMTSNYEISPSGSGQKTKPKQTQFKPNQSQFEFVSDFGTCPELVEGVEGSYEL